MDWQNKFYSIVRETDENLAKAKLKLAVKSVGFSDSVGETRSPRQTVNTQAFSQSVGGLPSFSRPLKTDVETSHLYIPPTEEFNMSAASGIQVLHMQEQIDAQNKTIDQLQKLVRSLDRERDFYKDRISHLQGEIDNLSDKMRSQMSLAGGERQMSRIKQEVIHEIDKVKNMLSNQTRSPRVITSHLSPRLDDELWNVKENLTENLDHIRRELRLMNKRIDRMESGISSNTSTKQEPFSANLRSILYQRSPESHKSSYTKTTDSSLDVNQLRSTINLLNTKLDSLENKIDASSRPQTRLDTFLHPASTPPYIPTSSYKGAFLPPEYDVDGVDDISSISGLSNLSDLSDNENDCIDNNDDLDDEIEAIIKKASARDNKRKSDSGAAIKSSIYKSESRRKGKVEFDLSDLDLSDVEAVDVDSDSLDL